MIWSVEYTDRASRDLDGIFAYICNHLQEPQIAKRQFKRITDAVNSLAFMPFRYRLYEKEPWHTLGFRVLPVNNYLILYLPDESNAVVFIHHIIYGGRDIEAQLKQSK